MGDSVPDFGGDDSYRRATDFTVPDDNLTAVGQAKSYRKTPYTSRIAGLDYGDKVDPYEADGPRDEHRLPIHELVGRLGTDVGNGLEHVQARALLEVNGPNIISESLKVPEWVRFCKCIFGGTNLLLWGGALLCFANWSIQAGLVRVYLDRCS